MTRFLCLLALAGVLGGCDAGLQQYELDDCKFRIKDFRDRQNKEVEIMNSSPRTMESRLAYLQYQIYSLEQQKFFQSKYKECWKEQP